MTLINHSTVGDFKMTIYLVSYACEPNQGGEHEVGWRVANNLAGRCLLKVITRQSNRNEIDACENNKIDFVFLENNYFLNIKPKGRFSYMYYIAWQWSAYSYLRGRVSKDDVIHYVTFGNIHLPHFLYLLKAKLLVGPLGGGAMANPGFIRNASFRIRIKFIIHTLLNYAAFINPFHYACCYKASRIVLRTKETYKLIPEPFKKKCDIFLETGVDIVSQKFQEKKKRRLKTIVTASRLIESKNVDQVIDVWTEIRKSTNSRVELKILGDGPLAQIFETRCTNLDGCHFLGRVPHSDVAGILRESDLFLFCSIKEGGSHALFEAAINSCPIACYDISGMSIFPNEHSAIKIRPTLSIDDNTQRLSESIVNAFNTDKINGMCDNAMSDLRGSYSWESIANRYIEIYKSIEDEK